MILPTSVKNIEDAANRLAQVCESTNGTSCTGVTTTYTYNGDGDRIAQEVVDSGVTTTTTYVLDVAVPLTMVLAETTTIDDGVNPPTTEPTITYLHGLGLVAQSNGANTEYFTYDGLGSVRQVVDDAGGVLLGQTFDPYGNPYEQAIASSWTGDTSYGFTGEMTDSNGLVFLRARYYNPSRGRFFQLDPSRQEMNLYQYSYNNPLNYTDPSGFSGNPPKLAMKLMVAYWSEVYSKDGYLRNCATTPDDGQWATDTVNDLLTDFICEYGPSHRDFKANAFLTQELARSHYIYFLRGKLYKGMEIESSSAMGFGDFWFATQDIFSEIERTTIEGGEYHLLLLGDFNLIPISGMHFFGGFDKIEIEKTSRGTIRFELLNKTDLVSGTRIPGVEKSETIPNVSMEELVSDDYLAPPSYNLLSVLKSRSSVDRNPNTPGLGGGEMEQRFVWEELYIPDWECGYPSYELVTSFIPGIMRYAEEG